MNQRKRSVTVSFSVLEFLCTVKTRNFWCFKSSRKICDFGKINKWFERKIGPSSYVVVHHFYIHNELIKICFLRKNRMFEKRLLINRPSCSIIIFVFLFCKRAVIISVCCFRMCLHFFHLVFVIVFTTMWTSVGASHRYCYCKLAQ